MRLRTYFSLGVVAVAIASGLGACSEGNKPAEQKETTTRGRIQIAVDESYMPVLSQELHVFDSSYPEAHITATYKTEKMCFEDLYKDSARLIVVSRDLTPAEKTAYKNNDINFKSLGIAMDAIAVVVNPASPDSFMTLGQLKQILLGKFARQYTVVFDNAQSGTVRYMLDSLIPGQQLPSNTYAVRNNDSVIDYVAKNEHAIGFVGVSHVYDENSTDPAGAFKQNIRVASLKNENDTAVTGFYQPYQAWIAQKKYPLHRTMYFITRDTWNGVGAGFANFLSNQAGQLIFLKARLVPLRVALRLREAEIK
ncbi:PstS family phosphate ABC transporter substrate-binding protein [Taibaiella koreensis]|uniref:PstS family phosphate ABC transporter substrate-binding protein n=1 Tax=Taibaiella koreensis TaxID=1268548 RepID=UPI000E5A0A58|nr:substrate-binding domain-containing protein [Taibaiella koreensis]